MSKKEEKAKEYIPVAYKRQYNSHLDSDDIKMAFESGWDTAKQKAIEYLKTILSMRSDVHPVVSEHFIKLVEQAMEE